MALQRNLVKVSNRFQISHQCLKRVKWGKTHRDVKIKFLFWLYLSLKASETSYRSSSLQQVIHIMFISLYTATELDLTVPMIFVVHVSAPKPMIFSILSSSWPSLHCRQGSMEAVQKCRLILYVWLHTWIATRRENWFFCMILVMLWVWQIHLQESKTTPTLKTKTKTLVFCCTFNS